MESWNQTAIKEFFILGVSKNPKIQALLFIVFLLVYMITLTGNITIIFLVSLDSHLHTPMYGFLCNLSFLDVCYTSVIIPKLLDIHLTQNKAISFVGCMTQQYLYGSITLTEFNVLAIMAFDRYVAICKPMHYTIVMSGRLCAMLSSVSWTIGFLAVLPLTVLLSGLSFCHFNVINHLLCDVKPLVQLSCSDTHIVEINVYLLTVLYGFIPFTLICTSYVYIISAILKIRSQEGRNRAFSTCSAHLTIVSLFTGTMVFSYVRPPSLDSLEKDKIMTVLYANVIPMLNPIIYSLRNREVKCALKKTRQHVRSTFQQSCFIGNFRH